MQVSSSRSTASARPSPRPSNNPPWPVPPEQLPQVSKAKKASKQGKKEPNTSLQTRTYYRRKVNTVNMANKSAKPIVGLKCFIYLFQEEKENLERKVLALNLQLQRLARRDVVEIRRDALNLKMKRNQELRESIQGQRIIFANTQSYISEFLVMSWR